jgi:hypothetical protein
MRAPNSINDGWFRGQPNVPSQWLHIPAVNRRAADGISFADSHVEMKRWTDRSVLIQRGALV